MSFRSPKGPDYNAAYIIVALGLLAAFVTAGLAIYRFWQQMPPAN